SISDGVGVGEADLTGTVRVHRPQAHRARNITDEHDFLSVRTPRRILVVEVAGGELRYTAAVRVHREELVVAFRWRYTCKNYLRAIRRPGRELACPDHRPPSAVQIDDANVRPESLICLKYHPRAVWRPLRRGIAEWKLISQPGHIRAV